MKFEIFDHNGPVLLKPRIIGDSRGYFMEIFRQNEFMKHCGDYTFVQDNQSKSTRGVLRGIHFQYKHPQGKLVRVFSGKVYDLAVDLRKSSPNFGKCYGVVLDDISHNLFWVPPGFGHGFMVMSETAEFVYKCTDYYAPEDEYTLLWNDPELNIDWPQGEPLLSEKDKKGLSFQECPKFS